MSFKLLLAVILLTFSVIGMECAAINLPQVRYIFDGILRLPSRTRRMMDHITGHGYSVEHHYIKTEDGYVLGVFRLPHSNKLQNQHNYRPIVIFQHGLMGASDYWLFIGPNEGLPYLLVDCGFDVWLGNSRGNFYSRKHNTHSAEGSKFWHFSWHEIGYYDIAATIDYSLETNGQGQKSIHFVGHSQGTTAFFALMSMRPEYNEKIKTAHMFAPIAIMKHMKNKWVHRLSPYLGHWNAFWKKFTDYEFLPYNNYILSISVGLCGPGKLLRPVCGYLIRKYYSNNSWNYTAMMNGIGNQPAGISFMQILHYIQEFKSGRFRQYDYGPKRNLELYNSEEPPDYPLENITSRVHLWYSSNDEMAAVEDVLALAERLPNRELHLMKDPQWDHDDFVLSREIRKSLHEPVIRVMKTFEES